MQNASVGSTERSPHLPPGRRAAGPLNALAIAGGWGCPGASSRRARPADRDDRSPTICSTNYKKRRDAPREASLKSFTAVEELRAELRGILESIEDERRDVRSPGARRRPGELEALRVGCAGCESG